MATIETIVFLATIALTLANTLNSPPHIIIILGDDIGYNDVGWQNERMHTPYIDQLAAEGVKLDRYYAATQCSPSRASLLTGYYSHRMGIQRAILMPMEPFGVPLHFKMLSEKLAEAGYRSHAIGKWHLGFCDWRYTPTFRGFESFIGFYNGMEEDYHHCVFYYKKNSTEEPCTSFDFRDNIKAGYEYNGIYNSEIFGNRAVTIINEYAPGDPPIFLYVSPTDTHFPVEPPERYLIHCNSSVNEARRQFCGAMAVTDEIVKNITEALKAKGMYENSVIIFTSDNGGSTLFGGNNYPLRGEKMTLYEGASRVPAFIHSPLLEKKGYTHKGLFHVTDWYPTIVRLARAKKEKDIDGIDQWDSFNLNTASRRTSLPYLIDVSDNGVPMAAIRDERYKLIGGPGGFSNVVTESETVDYSFNYTFMHDINFYALPFDFSDTTLKLFDLEDDPYESTNIASANPTKLQEMMEKLKAYQEASVPAFAIQKDIRGDPRRNNNTVAPGWCTAFFDPPQDNLINP